jgi:hypothetical protein
MRLRKGSARMGTIALEPAVSPANATIRRAEAPERQGPEPTSESSIDRWQAPRPSRSASRHWLPVTASPPCACACRLTPPRSYRSSTRRGGQVIRPGSARVNTSEASGRVSLRDEGGGLVSLVVSHEGSVQRPRRPSGPPHRGQVGRSRPFASCALSSHIEQSRFRQVGLMEKQGTCQIGGPL